ncbi:Alpha-(1-4)-fucosyltransferase [Nymphaea thermarum]|nr:Alpha-(1-4)-fucosyltransferase [Nymphaea thermarum]
MAAGWNCRHSEGNGNITEDPTMGQMSSIKLSLRELSKGAVPVKILRSMPFTPCSLHGRDHCRMALSLAPRPLTSRLNGRNMKAAKLTGLAGEEDIGLPLIDPVEGDSVEVGKRTLPLALAGKEEKNVEITFKTFGMEGNGPVFLVVNACLLKDLKEDVVGVSLIAQDVTSEKILMENFICVQGVGRTKGDPLRAYMDLEPGRRSSGYEDIFITYHAKDDVQSTYAGALFHNGRSYQISSKKQNDTLVYWSSSRCVWQRNRLAKKLLSMLPHHSFGKCLNNVGGTNMALTYYPECANRESAVPKWWDHLHCAMSHYKFVLAIENTMTESYVTEKLFYALDAGSVPIYFGAPNVWDFVPPNSIIDGTKFASLEELASYVKDLANDPVAYAEYHAWRRCGVMGSYHKARAMSLDTLPCRLCEAVSRKGGRDA